MARAKKVVDESVEAVVAEPVVEKKTRTRKKVEEKIETETVEIKAEEKKEEPAPVEEKVEETVPEVKEEVVVEEVVEATQIAPVDPVQEVIEATTTEKEVVAGDEGDSVIPEGFRPILRPTSVGGQPLGYVGCPKQVFDIVTRQGWRKGIESHKYRTQLFSILYWYQKNGSVSVRCNSSSKFAEVAH